MRFLAIAVLALVSSAAADPAKICGLAVDETLVKFECKDKSLADLSPLAGATALEYLDIRLTRVSNLAPVAKLATLRRIDMRGTKVTDLKPLAGLQLTDLNLSGTAVTDLRPLADMTTLGELDLSNSAVTNVKPLAKLKSLGQVDLRNTKVSKADAQWLGTIAEHVYWGDNGEGHFGTHVKH
jgi:internalin A